MRKVFKAISASILSIMLAVLSVVPVDAMPIQALSVSGQSDIIQVQSRRPPPPRRSSSSRPPPRSGYWNGYRGSRYSRPGYRRRNDGWWYPAAAFTAGAMVGAAASRPRTTTVVHHHHAPTPSLQSRHVSWCMNRFRSYRVSDNTFQPYSGGRRQCVSPYSVH